MAFQAPEQKRTDRLAPAIGLGVLLIIGYVIATNWRALIFVLIVLAAAAGWWIRG